MWDLPKQVILTSGVGVGSTEINAYDNALLNAGVGDYNLVKVTSVLPAGAIVSHNAEICRSYISKFPKGVIIPSVYTMKVSKRRGETISSALAIGIPKNQDSSGMIFEASLTGTKEVAEDLAKQMLIEALKTRNIMDYDVVSTSSEVTIVRGIGCTVSLAIMLP